MKRERNFHQTLVFKESVGFEFTTTIQTDIGLLCTGFDAFEFKFAPPIKPSGENTLRIYDPLSKITSALFSLFPSQILKTRNGNFLQMPTHVCQINQNEEITNLFLKIENTQTRGNLDNPIWQPKFRLGLFLPDILIGKDRYTPLEFVNLNDLKECDVSLVPQDNPIPLKPGGGMTGSKKAKEIGYFPGDKTDEKITGWKAVSMQFGRSNEFMVLMQYLKHHPEYKAKEAGFIGLKENSKDGCQPDAIILAGENEEWPLEIKCSRSNCNFEGSHIVQCVWEMACTKSPFMDLVKYCEKPINVNGNTWKTQKECREIRIYRSEELERELIEQKTPSQDLIQKFENLAKDCNAQFKVIPVDESIINTIQEFKKSFIETQEKEEDILDRIEKRHVKIFSAYSENKTDELINEVFEVIQDYGELIKK